MDNINNPLNKEEIKLLDQLIKKNSDEFGAADIFWMDGCLCAFIICKTIKSKNKYNEFIAQLKDTPDSSEEIALIMSLISRLSAEIKKKHSNNNYLPIYENEDFLSQDKLSLAEKWSKGFLYGISFISPEFVENEEFRFYLSPMHIVGGYAPKKGLKESGMTRSGFIEAIPLSISDIKEIFEEKKYYYKSNSEVVLTITPPKIDEACPCKSGKNYEQCCLSLVNSQIATA